MLPKLVAMMETYGVIIFCSLCRSKRLILICETRKGISNNFLVNLSAFTENLKTREDESETYDSFIGKKQARKK